MKVLLIGALGNMGARYRAILKHLEIETLELDEHDFDIGIDVAVAQSSHCIISTPTDTHGFIISRICQNLGQHQLDILCEKPITTSHLELLEIENVLRMTPSAHLYMVNQYCYMPSYTHFSSRSGLTRYNFYNSGNDGLGWDCIQLIALANGKVELSRNSPTWDVMVNGSTLNIADMNQAYVDMIKDFLGEKEKCWDWEQIELAHEKVQEWQLKTNPKYSS